MSVATTKRDYSEILGIARTADGGEVKRAYRRLATRCHPARPTENKPRAGTTFTDGAEARVGGGSYARGGGGRGGSRSRGSAACSAWSPPAPTAAARAPSSATTARPAAARAASSATGS